MRAHYGETNANCDRSSASCGSCPRDDLNAPMADLNQSEPVRFDCGKSGAEVVLSVAFSTGGAAEEFARQFGGKKGASNLI